MTTSRSNLPLSEQYRLKGLEWANANLEASIMEETKSSRLSQLIQSEIEKNPKLAHNAAERLVKASPEWDQEIRNMVAARTVANRLKIELEAIKLEHSEHSSLEANKRAEMKLY